MIRGILRSFLFLLFSTVALAQNTSVTATVVDSDSTVWANATWTLSFQVGLSQSNPANYTIGGAPLNPAVAYQSGVANGSGVITFTNYQSTAVQPAGSSWNLLVCPNASVACTRVNFATSNSSVDISSIVNAAITAPRFLAVSGAFGYNNGEATLSLKPGSTYWNTTSSTQECYTGSAWGACSSGGGGGTIGGSTTSPNVPYTTSADTLADSGFQYYLGGFDPAGDCPSDSQPCLQASQSGEGTASFSPNQISIVNLEDDNYSMVLEDFGLTETNLATQDYCTYEYDQIRCLASGGSDVVAWLNGPVLTLGANTVGDGQVIVNSGSTAAYSVVDPTGLTIGGSTSGQCAIGTTATGTSLIVGDNCGIETGTSSNTDLAGVMTASTGTATYTFSGTYTSSPVCIVQDDTTIASLLTKTVSTTVLTVTTTGATDSVSYICHGRN